VQVGDRLVAMFGKKKQIEKRIQKLGIGRRIT
jgi:hypothetical protein